MHNSTQQNRKDREMKRKRGQETGGKTRDGERRGKEKKGERVMEQERNRMRIFFEVNSRMHTLNRQSLLKSEYLIENLRSFINKPTADLEMYKGIKKKRKWRIEKKPS